MWLKLGLCFTCGIRSERKSREREIQSHCGRFTVYTHMYIHIFMYVYVYIYIYIYIHTNLCVCI